MSLSCESRYILVRGRGDFFEGFVEEVINLNISVTYKVKEEIDSPNKDIRAKFTYESVDYYLELTTAGEVEAKIEQYVNMLIG